MQRRKEEVLDKVVAAADEEGEAGSLAQAHTLIATSRKRERRTLQRAAQMARRASSSCVRSSQSQIRRPHNVHKKRDERTKATHFSPLATLGKLLKSLGSLGRGDSSK